MNTPTQAPRLLITAGPTHEPIDRVRYIGNRSSGRLGVALADAAARRGWSVTLLLGPTTLAPQNTNVQVLRFLTTADLDALLQTHFPHCDTLVMAAAVADYRPRPLADGHHDGKIQRSAGRLTIELEATPDLLAGCAARRRPGQTIVGFALEPRSRLMESARAKLERKGADFIIANPLETMDSQTIEAVMIGRGGFSRETRGPIAKPEFADWLLDALQSAAAPAPHESARA